MDVELKQYKTKLKIVSPDKELNNKLMSMLKEEHDCFGVDYSESHEECKKCTILAEIGDKRSSLHEFCKEFVENRNAALKFAEVEIKEKGKVEPEEEKDEEEEMGDEEIEKGELKMAEAEKEVKEEKVKKEKKVKEKKEKKLAKSCNKGLLDAAVALIKEGKNDTEVLAGIMEKCKGNEKRAVRYLQRAKAAGK